MATFAELVHKSRSIRRFQQTPIPRATLVNLVDLARIASSGGNVQPLKYLVSCDAETNARIFPHLAWAGYLTDWPGPAEGERPTGYVAILLDRNVSHEPGCDHGIAAAALCYAACEAGLGSCMIGSIHREALASALQLDERFKILLVVALGEPGETVVLEPVGADGSIRYWRDDAGVHHVPKRALDEVLVVLP